MLFPHTVPLVNVLKGPPEQESFNSEEHTPKCNEQNVSGSELAPAWLHRGSELCRARGTDGHQVCPHRVILAALGQAQILLTKISPGSSALGVQEV